MSLKYKLPGFGWLLLLFIFLLNSPIIRAQSDTIQFQKLAVELWPEYDRPEVLVIYRVELSPNTPLPAQLTFRLPDYVETMHAVAVERDDSLFTVESELSREDGASLLTFSATSQFVQFEYYDSVILAKQGQARQIDFNFSIPYDIEATTFQVQAPFQAQNFTLTPAPSGNFTDGDGLIYSIIDVAGLASGETFELTASYQRNTDTPSHQLINPTAGQTVDVLTSSEVSVNEQNLSLGYILVGVGIALLLGAGGYWWWSNQVTTPPTQELQPPPPKAARTPPPPPGRATGGFCYQCGTALHAGAKFCHACGAERRG